MYQIILEPELVQKPLDARSWSRIF